MQILKLVIFKLFSVCLEEPVGAHLYSRVLVARVFVSRVLVASVADSVSKETVRAINEQ